MPKESEVPPDFLEDQLKRWQIYHQGNLRGTGDPIWKNIKQSLQLSMKAYSIHLYVYNNEHKSDGHVRTYFGLPPRQPRKRKRNLDPEYDPGDIKNPHNCMEMNFTVVLPSSAIGK